MACNSMVADKHLQDLGEAICGQTCRRLGMVRLAQDRHPPQIEELQEIERTSAPRGWLLTHQPLGGLTFGLQSPKMLLTVLVQPVGYE